MRHRNFTFTLHNYTDEDVDNLLTKLKYQYIVFAKEICPSTGTPHLQGYCELVGQLERDQIKEAISNGKIHIKNRYGSQARAIAYIKTPEDIPEFRDKGKLNPLPDMLFERGEPKRQGARTDLDIARSLLVAGRALDPLDPDYTIGVQKAYEQIQKYVQMPGNRSKPRVIWHYGKGGSGKTQRAYEISIGNVYKCDLLRYGWLDGYNNHETVIVDDLTVEESNRERTLDLLLKMFDKYPLRMNVKGSSCWFNPKLVIVTSQQKPQEMFGLLNSYELDDPFAWRKDVELRQLMRRIDQLVECELEDNEELTFPETIKVKVRAQKS